MTFRYSLRSRIIISFCLFGAVLGIVYATAVYVSLDKIDDHLVDSRLKEELETINSHYLKSKRLPQPTSPYITAYIGTSNMSPSVVDLTMGLAEGLHESYIGDEEYHIAVKKVQDQKEKLYLLYEVSALEFTEKRKGSIGFVLIAGVVLMVALGFWIGWFTSRKVIAPVIHLSNMVDKSGPDNLPIDLSKTFSNDEVGVLSKALEQAMYRVETYVEREQRFSRYASHELRTPVTVIKGAVTLLKKKFISEEDPAIRPLRRIERSAVNMENIIETLLWLSRDEITIDQNHVFSVESVIRDTIEQNSVMLVNKPINIELVSEDTPKLHIPESIFQIMVTNLIRNAIQHTASGQINVIIKTDRIVVSDPGSGIEPNDLKLIMQFHFFGDREKGFGLGLSIVNRLCIRLGWELKIESEKGLGTTAELIFRTASN